MKLADLLDINELEREIEDGYVERRYHRTLPLTLYCYSRSATYEDRWNNVTEQCRGLIVDATGEVVARPFRKFHNLNTTFAPETWLSNLPLKEQPVVLEKLDGSLGIIWRYGSFSGVASKGSFQSEHAYWASDWYEDNCKNPQWPAGYTPVVEMICQKVQRHVVHYDIPDQLILLALVNNDTGEELSYNEVYFYAGLNGMKTADIFAKSVGDVLLEDRENKEGYVLSYPRKGLPPLKIKVKHETFLKLQKIVHNATPKSILEALIDGDRELIQTWIDGANPDLSEFVSGWTARLIEAYGRILHNAGKLVQNANLRNYERKDAVAFFQLEENRIYAPVCFSILDGKETKSIVWKLVRDTFQDELTRPILGDPYDDKDNIKELEVI